VPELRHIRLDRERQQLAKKGRAGEAVEGFLRWACGTPDGTSYDAMPASMQPVSRLHRQLPDSATRTAPGAGHAAWFDAPGAFAEIASCPTTQATPTLPVTSETGLQVTSARRCRGQTSMVAAAPSG
jgi:hypothetical protein